jgi:hypothetical protein
MSIAESSASLEVSELTPEEAAAAFDRIARTALDLSGAEFLAALDEGKFDDVDPDAHPGLLDVLMALPLVSGRSVPGSHRARLGLPGHGQGRRLASRSHGHE